MSQIEVVVNGRSLSRPVTGVQRYTAEILNCLEERVQVIRPSGSLQGWKGHAWEQFTLPSLLKGQSILWSPANTGPLAVSRQVLTLHDLSPLEHPEWFKSSFSIWYRLFLPILVRRVSCIITPSEYVRRKIISRFQLPKARVVAVHPGVNLEQFHRQASPGQQGRYILFVGSLEPRKNLATLLRAWKEIEAHHLDVSLVIAGAPGNVFREVVLPVGIPRLRLAGVVPDAVLSALYSGADLFILPSWDEGFGLPVLEAMACETPVVASNAGALPEVVGEAGLLFSPGDPGELSRMISSCLYNPQLRKNLSEHGLDHVRQFSWQTTADRIWQTWWSLSDSERNI